jgi:hypothetical protein
MQVKTNELEGAALDWAVFHAVNKRFLLRSYKPSTDWAQGGPIIQKWPGIFLFPLLEPQGWFQAEIWPEPQNLAARCTGPTPLIAAMRAYVASKFGEEVTLPAL